jgi:hypothetical protein
VNRTAHSRENGTVFVEDAFSWLASLGAASGAYPYKAGDRVLVLIGDTFLPAVIESACEPTKAGETEWSVRRQGAGLAYRIPESFLRPDMMSPA